MKRLAFLRTPFAYFGSNLDLVRAIFRPLPPMEHCPTGMFPPESGATLLPSLRPGSGFPREAPR